MNGRRKVAILGDMLEQAENTGESHKEVGELAGKICDEIIFVGKFANYFEQGAIKNIETKNIFKVKDVDEAAEKVKNIIQPGDLVLIKGSRKIALEKVVEKLKKGV